MPQRTPDQSDTTVGSELLLRCPEWEQAKKTFTTSALATFPSFIELLSTENTTPTESRSGNFVELLGEDPAALWADLCEHPECYDQAAELLLRRLMEGATSVAQLTKDERRVLDLATIEMAIRRNKPPPVPQRAVARKVKGTGPRVPSVPRPKALRPTAPPASVPSGRWWGP